MIKSLKNDYFDRHCIRIFSHSKNLDALKNTKNTISRADSSAPEKTHWLAQVGQKTQQNTHKKKHLKNIIFGRNIVFF